MLRKAILAVFCLAQFSIISANDLKKNLNFKSNTESEYFQKIPKTIIIKTKKFKVRIDQQPNGNYLYQSWGANSKITSKPSMIISNGEVVPDGTGGNYFYEFSNNGYIYQVFRNYLTDSANKAPYTLVVINDKGETIVRQDAQIVKQ